MKNFTGLTIAVASAALMLATTVADARDGRWRGHHRHSRVIIEQPAVGLGVGLAGVLLLGQMLNQQQPQFEEQLQPLPREPKLRRESPIPLK